MSKYTASHLTALFSLCLGLVSGAQAQCTVDPVNGTVCIPDQGGTVAVGAVFASDSGARRNVALALVEELLEEEAEEETGGGAGDGMPFDLFASFIYADTEFERGTQVPGRDGDSLGLVVGATLRGSQYFAGAALDYSKQDGSIEAGGNNSGDIDSDEFGIQLYGTYFPTATKRLFLSAAARYAWADVDTERTFLSDGTNSVNTARGNNDATSYGLTGGLGYSQPIADRTAVSLSGWLAWQRNENDEFSETGAIPDQSGDNTTSGNLRYQADNYSTLDGIVTVDVVHDIPMANGRLRPSAFLSLVHEFESDTRTINATLVDDPTDPTAFVVFRTQEADKNYFRLGASLTAEYDHGTTLHASYAGTAGHDWRSEHLFSLGIRQAF